MHVYLLFENNHRLESGEMMETPFFHAGFVSMRLASRRVVPSAKHFQRHVRAAAGGFPLDDFVSRCARCR